MVLRIKDICKLIIICFIAINSAGCAKAIELPDYYPDYSTPEHTFWTSYYAVKTGDYERYLNSLSDEYRIKFGKTTPEQLDYCQTEIKISPEKKKSVREIIDIEYGDFGDHDVKIIWSEKIGEKYYIKRSWTPLKKVGDTWLIIFPQSEM